MHQQPQLVPTITIARTMPYSGEWMQQHRQQLPQHLITKHIDGQKCCIPEISKVVEVRTFAHMQGVSSHCLTWTQPSGWEQTGYGNWSEIERGGKYLYSDSIREKMFSSKRPAIVSIAGIMTLSFWRLTRRISSKHFKVAISPCSEIESR